jgi:hypothetical protein
MRYVLLLVIVALLYNGYANYRPAFRSRAELTDYILGYAPRPGDPPPAWPSWLQRACPQVVRHFERYPYFANFTEVFSVMTSEYAAHSVCSLSIAARLAKAVGSHLYLHAGSHLGALVHAGPIPWDDDVDAIMPFGAQEAFMKECARLRFAGDLGGAVLICVRGHNAIKLSVITRDSQVTLRGWASPFVDVFLYETDDTHIYEVTPEGKPTAQRFHVSEYLPTRPYYFGGITVPGPREQIALRRYDTRRCVVSCFHHRLEANPSCKGKYDLACPRLAERFLFVNASRDLVPRPSASWMYGTVSPSKS